MYISSSVISVVTYCSCRMNNHKLQLIRPQLAHTLRKSIDYNIRIWLKYSIPHHGQITYIYLREQKLFQQIFIHIYIYIYIRIIVVNDIHIHKDGKYFTLRIHVYRYNPTSVSKQTVARKERLLWNTNTILNSNGKVYVPFI